MSGQIIFFEKNIVDYANTSALAQATEANDLASQVQNRNNMTAWVTTGSQDSVNTQFIMYMGDLRTVSDIILVKHNFKDFKVEYWNGAAYVDFTSPIDVIDCQNSTSHYIVDPVMTSRVRITIFGTQIPDTDKVLYQLIITNRIGQLNGWPVIKAPTHVRNRRVSAMLSGKGSVSLGIGAFSCALDVKVWKDSQDLSLIEDLCSRSEGFLVWLCGGNEDQFSMKLKGYRMEDLFLMRVTSDYSPEYYQGLYQSGVAINLKLAEVVD